MLNDWPGDVLDTNAVSTIDERDKNTQVKDNSPTQRAIMANGSYPPALANTQVQNPALPISTTDKSAPDAVSLDRAGHDVTFVYPADSLSLQQLAVLGGDGKHSGESRALEHANVKQNGLHDDTTQEAGS